ncbi:reverse transcriptase domain-containing protein [Tanacetum coccineum]
MRTRSQSRNSNRQQQQVNPNFVEPFNLVEPVPVVTMDDNRTMAQMLEAPTVDSLNSAAGGNFLDKMPRDCLRIIESKSKVRNSRNKPVVTKVSASSSTPGISPDVAELKDMVKTLLLDKKNQNQALTPVKAVEESCVTYGGAHSYQNCPATDGVSKTDFESYFKANDAVMRNVQNQTQNMQNQMTNLTDLLTKFMNSNTASTSGSGTLPSITTRSSVAYQEPTISTKVVERETKVTKDTVLPINNGSTKDVQPPVVHVETNVPISEPFVALVSAPMLNPKPSIPFPSRRNDERRREKANDQIEKFYEIFRDMSFEISFADALIFMPKFASTLKALIGNKEKLNEMARTPLNEHCSAVILNKFLEKLGDPGKFLIPCEFPRMDECLALADLCASINLMPLSVWKKLNLLDLTPTCMTLELVDRSITKPIGIAVSVKVGVFHFPADFVVVDFDADPRVPLIFGRSFLKTRRALIDVYEGELTLRVGKEAITFKLDRTSKYSANYNDMTANRIDVVEMACEEYSQEVLGFSDVIASGNPTPGYDPIVSNSSSTLTPFEDSDFLLLEEADAFLALEDEPVSPEIDESYYDPEGDILLLEAILNSNPSPPSNQGNYLPKIRKELKICEAKTVKSSIDEPPEVELKDLPPHLEYAFLEDNNKLPVIIAKDLSVDEKTALIKDYEPAVQHQEGGYPKIHDVIKKEVEKLLDAGLIYPISDIHCVPKKGGMTVVANEDNELIPTQLVTGWRVCIDYRKLKEATRKDHFPLPFMDQMLERLTGNEFYCFLDGFLGYFEIPIDLQDQEKTTFTCPYGTFAYRCMPFGLCNAPGTFQRCMMGIFHDMIEKTMEVFMDDFSVFGDSFASCLSNLDKMLKRCEDTNLFLNWEKCHFMCKEGIMLGHKISKSGIEVDRAKVDVIAKLPHPTTVKGVRSFLGPTGGHHSANLTARKGIDFMGPFSSSHGNKYILVAVDYLSKWVEAKALPTNDARVVVKFLKSLFARFGTPRAIISDRGTYFCNDQFAKVMSKTVGENRASWPDKLDDALWAFRTAFKTPIVVRLQVEYTGNFLPFTFRVCDNKAYWALKHANFDLKTAGDHRKLQLNELNELRDQAYENSLIYKERTKKLHDSKIKNRIFNVGDRVLLFNSRLKIFSGKLKTRWSGPFTITKVFPYGTIELSQPDGPNFKVNGHRVKHYFGGDLPPKEVQDLHTLPKDE